MPNKRGGQKKHWAEKARIWAWYNEIIYRCGWTDGDLDNEFAWRDACKAEISSADRPRIFEGIRTKARIPVSKDIRWRSMPDLVVAVEQHPCFKNTQSLYDAAIWRLLQENTISPQLLQSNIDLLLQANGLLRVTFEDLPVNLLLKYGRAPLYDKCLRLSLSKMGRLSKLDLVWFLYLQNEPSQNWEFRAKIELIADELLDYFFMTYIPEHHLQFYPDALECLQQTRINNISTLNMGYGHLEGIGSRPILPKHLVGKLEEKHFSIDYVDVA